jgi:hypothetical protein
MNLIILKQLAILSAFVGVIGGLVALLPPFTLLMLLSAFIFPAILVLVYLKQNDLIGIINTREGAIFGSIIGFISFIASFVVYAPISILLAWIIKLISGDFYIPGFLRLLPFDIGTIIVLIFSVIFLAGLSAVFNGFWGLVTAWVYELITGVKKESYQNNSVDFEIK